MNGIEKITRRIAEEAQAEIDERLSRAREEAEGVTSRYRAEAEAQARELAARNEKAAAEREERLISAAQMDARKGILAAKQELVDRAYDLALKKLTSLPEKEYVKVLADLLAEASTGGAEEVLFSAKDRDRVGKAAVEQANKAAGKSLTLSQETRDIQGGFILKDRNVEVNCAFETLVRLQRAETAGEVAKMLFP